MKTSLDRFLSKQSHTNVDKLDVLVQVSDDVFEEEEFLVILEDLVILVHVFLARQALVKCPQVLVLVPPEYNLISLVGTLYLRVYLHNYVYSYRVCLCSLNKT